MNISTLGKNHEIFSSKYQRVFGKVKIETPKNIFRDEYFSLKSKAHSFECGKDNKKKLKGTFKSQSEDNNFEEYYKRQFR